MTARGSPPGAFSHPGFARLAKELARHAGLKIPAHRYPDLEQAARRGMARARIDDPSEYARHVAEGRLPLADLVGAFTVGETYFFRDPPQFDLLRSRVVPDVLARRGASHVFRAWSAGCASGEEPYSLAILLDGMGHGDRSHVLGTDISRPALARARAAEYGAWSIRGPARAMAARALERRGERHAVPARLRARVRIEYLNLAEDVYPSVMNATAGLDLILCRNVFIYFEPAVVAAVARRLYACLAEGGWLFPGLADPPLGVHAPFQSVSTEAGVVYRKPGRGEEAARRIRIGSAGTSAAGSATAITSGAVGGLEGARGTPGRARAEAGTERGPGATGHGKRVTGTETGPRATGHGKRVTGTETGPRPTGHGKRVTGTDTPGTFTGTGTTSPSPSPPTLASELPALDRARGLAAAGEWAAVLALADPLLETAEGAAALVRAAANSGDLASADELSLRATGRHPLAPELHLLRAAALSEVGRVDEALAAVRRALYLDRGLAIAHASLGGLLAGRGDVEEARRAWRNAHRICATLPADAPLPLGDGECAGRLSEIASAQLSILGGDPEL